jgi:hypothetical protein
VLTVLYCVPIVALPILVVGFGVLVLTTKPPSNVPLLKREAADTRKPAAAISGASSLVKPNLKATGASDPIFGQLGRSDGSADYLHIGNGVVVTVPTSK